MLKTFATAFLVLFAFHCVSSLRGVDYRLDLISQRSLTYAATEGDPNSTVITCKSSGYFCGNCTDVYACMNIGGSLKPMKTRTCKAPETCFNGNCTTGNNPQCSGASSSPFICNAVGTLPDPFDCKKYHMCYPEGNGLKVANVDCTGNYSYNAKTMFCDKKLTGGICSTNTADLPVPLCTSYEQSAALKENPSLFYFCMDYPEKPGLLYPYLFACDNGGLYDSKTLSCTIK